MGRAQASVEFITTYGWMIMVAALVAGALAYFGVFTPESNLPQQCMFGYDFSCNQYVIHTNGTVVFSLGNKIGEPLQATNITCVYENGDSYSGAVPMVTWGAGDVMSFDCTPATPRGGLETGEREQVIVQLEYRKVSGGFVKTVQGQISANAVDRS